MFFVQISVAFRLVWAVSRSAGIPFVLVYLSCLLPPHQRGQPPAISFPIPILLGYYMCAK